MPKYFARSTVHAAELFDTDVRLFELARLVQELAQAAAKESGSPSGEQQDA